MGSIYRVHKHLRDVNKKAYEPETIAIGPYHRHKDSVKMMEEHKSRYLELLLTRRKQKLEMYTTAIGKLEQEARNCYAEPISLNAAKFTEMLVRDGCIIIELIRKFSKRDATCKNDPIFQMEWIMNSLQRDLILFENQIPFFVLRKLFDLIEVPGQHERLIHLVLKFWQNLHPGGEYKTKKNMSSQKIHHLLDLIHRNYRPPIAADVYVDVDRDASQMRRESLIIHSATELTDANVKFKKKKSGTLFDIEFHKGFILLPPKGFILMPPLNIEDRTECFFRNLIAYEQYFSDGRPNYVTDYVRFLDCLINSSRDVDILCESGIINNWLGDNKVVARMVNRLADSVTGTVKNFIYARTFDRVNKHYKRRWSRAWALLHRDYFNSPWAYATFFAALAILLLTVAQTVCSILQVV